MAMNRVSVVLVNYRGVDDTLVAIQTLRTLDWPSESLEIVVVENDSGDDSLGRLEALGDQITLIASEENLGFAGGSNLGASHATGEFIAFLNNDARPDPLWIANAVERFRTSPRIGAVASRVLDWDGERVDFVGAALTWYGMGYKPRTGEKFTGDDLAPGDHVLFGTGSSMFVRRDVFIELGGFDERYFMFFEDVDFGWRLNLRGWIFAYEPGSVAFHKHHASMTSFGSWKEEFLLERNALFTLYKNASDEMLSSSLPAALALAVRRGMSRSDLDSMELDIRRKGDDAVTDRAVPKSTVAALYAIDQFVENLPTLAESRREIQASRVAADPVISRLFRETDVPGQTDRSYLDGYVNISQAFGVVNRTPRLRVLVITGDPLGAKLSGPGIRSWNIADTLADDHEVRLVTLSKLDVHSPRFDTASVSIGDQHGMKVHVDWCDVVIFQGLAMALFSAVEKTEKTVIVDVYDPMHLEQLEQARSHDQNKWTKDVESATEVLNQQLKRADFLICASERQRHFYLGQLAALGRISPLNYASDPDLKRLIDVVPFGLSEKPPAQDRHALRGNRPGFDPEDKILLWSGGLYDWFDPHTLIEAVALLAEQHPEVKLFFQGTKNPNPGVPEMEIVGSSRALARSLGVLDHNVFFNDSWVDFDDRQNYLLDADVGVSTHFDHLETTFSFRTRILDYLWAGLPMVVTTGDGFADLIRDEELGIVVPERDPAALARGLEQALFDEEFNSRARANIKRIRERFYWSKVLDPLVRFMESPQPAPDRIGELRESRIARSESIIPLGGRRYGLRHDLSRVRHYLRTEGLGSVGRKTIRRLGTALRR